MRPRRCKDDSDYDLGSELRERWGVVIVFESYAAALERLNYVAKIREEDGEMLVLRVVGLLITLSAL